jgi:hypothetical protein
VLHNVVTRAVELNASVLNFPASRAD